MPDITPEQRIERERELREVAEEHYRLACLAGDRLNDEVKRLRAEVLKLQNENARLRADMGRQLEPHSLDIASTY